MTMAAQKNIEFFGGLLAIILINNYPGPAKIRLLKAIMAKINVFYSPNK